LVKVVSTFHSAEGLAKVAPASNSTTNLSTGRLTVHQYKPRRKLGKFQTDPFLLAGFAMLRAIPRQTVFAIAFAALTLPGCFSDGKVNVSGSVTVDGQPVVQGTIRFAPADGDGPSDGATIDQGRYSAEVLAGTKSVHIEAYKKVGEAPHDRNDPSSPILPVYETLTTHDTTADVMASTADLNFDLPAP
jgi:hypothetical protein